MRRNPPPGSFQWLAAGYVTAIGLVVLFARFATRDKCSNFGECVLNRTASISVVFFILTLGVIIHDRIRIFKTLPAKTSVKVCLLIATGLFLYISIVSTIADPFMHYIAPVFAAYWLLYQDVMVIEWSHVVGKFSLEHFGSLVRRSANRRVANVNATLAFNDPIESRESIESWLVVICLSLVCMCPYLVLLILGRWASIPSQAFLHVTGYISLIMYVLSVSATMRKGWVVSAIVALYLTILALILDAGCSVKRSNRGFVYFGFYLLLLLSLCSALNIFKVHISWNRLNIKGLVNLLESYVLASRRCVVRFEACKGCCPSYDHYGSDKNFNAVPSIWGTSSIQTPEMLLNPILKPNVVLDDEDVRSAVEGRADHTFGGEGHLEEHFGEDDGTELFDDAEDAFENATTTAHTFLLGGIQKLFRSSSYQNVPFSESGGQSSGVQLTQQGSLSPKPSSQHSPTRQLLMPASGLSDSLPPEYDRLGTQAMNGEGSLHADFEDLPPLKRTVKQVTDGSVYTSLALLSFYCFTAFLISSMVQLSTLLCSSKDSRNARSDSNALRAVQRPLFTVLVLGWSGLVLLYGLSLISSHQRTRRYNLLRQRFFLRNLAVRATVDCGEQPLDGAVVSPDASTVLQDRSAAVMAI